MRWTWCIRNLMFVSLKAIMKASLIYDGRYQPYIFKLKSRIASVWIHLERAIGRVKEFRILQAVLPINLRPILDQVLFMYAALDTKLIK